MGRATDGLDAGILSDMRRNMQRAEKRLATMRGKVYETDYGNAALVYRDHKGRLRAYDLDMGGSVPFSSLTKKVLRDADEAELARFE